MRERSSMNGRIQIYSYFVLPTEVGTENKATVDRMFGSLNDDLASRHSAIRLGECLVKQRSFTQRPYD